MTESTADHSRITFEPARMGDLPCVQDACVTMAMVLGRPTADRSGADVSQGYAYIERVEIVNCLPNGAAMVNGRPVDISRGA